ILAQAEMLYVGRHADDLAPAVGASIADALADRVFVREVAARLRLADDDDFWRILAVAFVALAPGDEPHPHRSEIGVAHGAEPPHRPLIRLRRGTAFDQKPGGVVVARERERRTRRRRSHAGQRLHAF